jgi:hypothetical protein
MESVLDNSFVVFKRRQPDRHVSPQLMEEPWAACESYAEARQLLNQLHRAHQDGVIRFQGATGGGD